MVLSLDCLTHNKGKHERVVRSSLLNVLVRSQITDSLHTFDSLFSLPGTKLDSRYLRKVFGNEKF